MLLKKNARIALFRIVRFGFGTILKSVLCPKGILRDLYKYRRSDSSSNVEPKPLDRPPVAGCGIYYKPRPLNVARWV